MALLSRYRVEYLSITWILGIFAAASFGCIPIISWMYPTDVGVLNSILVLVLLCTTFLQSIYPLSFTMPGYLQLGRMLKYASPAAVIIFYYVVKGVVERQMHVYEWDTLWDNFFTLDVLMRFAALILSALYISGIVILPRRMLKDDASIPRYVKGYCTAMAVAFVFFLGLCLHFSAELMLAYIYIFTLLNLYIVMRTLETMAKRLLHPTPQQQQEPETQQEAVSEEGEDFNEDNLRRARLADNYMKHTDEWSNPTFGRDNLCREIGVNRHLLLQALRSQGWNDTHEYITSFRVTRLRQIIESHPKDSLTNVCYDAGFCTVRTAKAAFLKFLDKSLDDFWREHTTSEGE